MSHAITLARLFVCPPTRSPPAVRPTVIDEFAAGPVETDLTSLLLPLSSVFTRRFAPAVKNIDRRRTPMALHNPVLLLTPEACAKCESPMNNIDKTNEFAPVIIISFG